MEKRSQSKLSHEIRDAPVRLAADTFHREIRNSEDDNVGVESAHRLEEVMEGGVQTYVSAHRAQQRRRDHGESPQFQSNSYSRWKQKQTIQSSYRAKSRGAAGTSAKTAKAARQTEKITAKVGAFFQSHKKGILIAIAITVLLIFFLNLFSSCSVLFQAGLSAVSATTYPNEDSDMRLAEERYCAMEAELQAYLDQFELTHEYDEYHFDLDEIGHDPYVLISAITALYGGAWEIDGVDEILQQLFDAQYILNETVSTETRYRPEMQIDYIPVTDPATGVVSLIPYEYQVQVPYSYELCTVTLENFDLSHVPVYIMTEEQLSMYATYMSTLGNRPDLFESSRYVDLYYNTDYEDYEIPPEDLQNETFAAMIEEAEKYLGYPYVWGGSSPETSFDCSGFVSWVINHCGVGWNIGRLGAEGLRQLCTRVSLANARPGDLIFFQGTYETSGASHVGIYVGNGMMLHCGDPIQYTSINTSYWQGHFLSYGRLPNP